MECVALKAKLRERTGKSVARKLRQEGRIPCIVYAKGMDPINISIDSRECIKLLHKHGTKVVFDVSIESESKPQKHALIIKDIQYNALKEGITHIDFQQIKLDEKIRVKLPLLTKGDEEAVGVKAGGILEHIVRELEVECLGSNMPKEIVVDVTGLGVGQAIHVKEIELPEGITALDDPEKVVVLVKFEVEKEVEAEAEQAEVSAGPEVIKQKKTEEESS